ncbi:hypothetical protein DPMN_064316 [Dreissena polymorpha]|uniref:Uncharacterized protein n=1 Tax=Dreissena polymorpha TaxID=45954 RepID=A0A9D4CDD6_DREPO|nr:hypothetical protein DPMN_064316 [Dreissena polymorpha]
MHCLLIKISLLHHLLVGNTLILCSTIRRTEAKGRVLILTSASKVLMLGPLQVPPQHRQDGERLLNPPPTELVQIKTALTLPAKKRVSISGKVTQVCSEKKLFMKIDIFK